MSIEVPLNVSSAAETGVRFFAGATLAASVMASGYVNYELHNDGDHTWSVEIPGETKVVSSETVITPTGGRNKVEMRPVEGASTEETEVGEEYGMGESPYAREYADDAAAEFVDAGAIEQLNHTVTSMEKEGWSNFRITVIGRSSGEDDMSRPDAGLTTPSARDRNVELARTRAFSFVDEMQKNEKLAAIPIEATTGVEEDLSPEELEAFDAMRSQFGYQSVSEMVQAWNDNSKDVPPTVESTLAAVLGNKRGVLVTINASRPVAGEATVTEEQAVCVVPVRESITNYVEYEPRHLPVPKGMIIGIPVVWPYRRRNKQAQAGSNPAADDDSFGALLSRYSAATMPKPKKIGGVAGVGVNGKPNLVVISQQEVEGESLLKVEKRIDIPPKAKATAPARNPEKPVVQERKPRNWRKIFKIGGVIIGAAVLTTGVGYCAAQIDLPDSFTQAPNDPCNDDMPRENNVVRTSERNLPADPNY